MRIVAPRTFGSPFEKLLPESVTDHRYCVTSGQSPAGSVYILISGESTSKHGLRAQHRKKVPRSLRDVGARADAHSAKVHIVFLKERGIGEICTLLPPIVKLLRAVVGWNELMEQRQAVRFAKWKGAQQQCIDYAKNTGVRAYADSESGDGESCLPRTG